MTLTLYLGLFAAGAVVGSFLNVCIHRLPRRQSILWPPSQCPTCGTRIAPWDNLPLMSYLLLRGRCRACGQRISPRYLLVEFLAGACVVYGYHCFGFGPLFWHRMLLSLLLLTVTFIDLEHKLILNVITFPGIAAGIVWAFLLHLPPVAQSVLGLLVGGTFLLSVGLLGRALFRKETMGGGDVKLAAMVGAFLGPWPALASLLLAFGIAGLFAVSLIAAGKMKLSSALPFGPFIAMGSWLVVFWGPTLLRWYLAVVL